MGSGALSIWEWAGGLLSKNVGQVMPVFVACWLGVVLNSISILAATVTEIGILVLSYYLAYGQGDTLYENGQGATL